MEVKVKFDENGYIDPNFAPNGNMFGMYAVIKTDLDQKPFIYKVVSLFASNSYLDVPIRYPKTNKLHDEIVPVLGVICCGILEEEVLRVALKDVDRVYWGKISRRLSMRGGFAACTWSASRAKKRTRISKNLKSLIIIAQTVAIPRFMVRRLAVIMRSTIPKWSILRRLIALIAGQK